MNIVLLNDDLKNTDPNKYWMPDKIITDIRTGDVKKTLYVNAWDPWSFIGNGHCNDNTMDGHWGCLSNMSMLGWGITNPHIKFMQINETDGSIIKTEPTSNIIRMRHALITQLSHLGSNNMLKTYPVEKGLVGGFRKSQKVKHSKSSNSSKKLSPTGKRKTSKTPKHT